MRPTPEAIDWLKNREGYREDVYLDTEDIPTVGYGHRVLPEENFPVGSKISEVTASLLLSDDAQNAWEAAVKQAEEAGDASLVEPLFHVNYQLGTNWNKIHENTWELVKSGDRAGAAAEAERSSKPGRKSLWFEQTPKRVRDFQHALLGKPRQEEYDY